MTTATFKADRYETVKTLISTIADYVDNNTYQKVKNEFGGVLPQEYREGLPKEVQQMEIPENKK